MCGLTYNTCGHFAPLLIFFLAPSGLGKMLHNSQNIRAYYMLTNTIRCMYRLCTKSMVFQLASKKKKTFKATLVKKPTGLPPASWVFNLAMFDLNYLFLIFNCLAPLTFVLWILLWVNKGYLFFIFYDYFAFMQK